MRRGNLISIIYEIATPSFAGFAMTLLLSSFLFASPQKIQIKTPDGTVLSALFTPPVGDNPLVLMLHGLDSSKEEWQPLISELEKAKWGTMTYDARRSGTPWQKWVDDEGAVVRFIEKAGTPRSRIFLVGASLGANVSLKYSELTRVGKGLILLSPGLNYQGLITADSVGKVSAPILIVASPADAYAASSSLELKKISKHVQLWMDVKPGHGVQMFDPALLARILDWLEKQNTHP